MKERKTSFNDVLISLIKCAGYYGVYYLLNIVVTVALILVMAVIKPNADAETTLNSLVIPLTLLCNALFLLGTAMFYNRKGSYVSFADRVQVYPFNSRLLPFIICLGITAMFTVNIILNLIPFPESWQEMLNENSDMISSSSMLMQIVCVGLIGPIAEEVIFRGLMLKALRRSMHPWVAIVLSSIVFGVVHGNPIGIIYATGMGILMGWLYHRTGSIVACSLFHMVYNLMSLFAIYIPEEMLVMITLLSLPIFAVCIICIARIPATTKNNENDDEV
jgi:membrane protease YdiL (CAAX protease family)